MPTRCRTVLAALALLCAPSQVLAQGPCRDFSVTVRDAATGGPLAGAAVAILWSGTDARVHVGATDSAGTFRAPGGSVGAYRVQAEAPGYAPGEALTRCPSAGIGRAEILLRRAEPAAAPEGAGGEASWVALARDERVEIAFDGAHVRRVGARRHRLRMRWSYPVAQGGDDAEPFPYDRVETEVEVDCAARTLSRGDETLYLGDRVTQSRMGLWHPGAPPVPGTVGERAVVALCGFLTL